MPSDPLFAWADRSVEVNYSAEEWREVLQARKKKKALTAGEDEAKASAQAQSEEAAGRETALDWRSEADEKSDPRRQTGGEFYEDSHNSGHIENTEV